MIKRGSAAEDVCPGDEVRAFVLWDPWAILTAIGVKTVETRSWETRYRGPLLICAAKHWSADEQAAFLSAEIREALGIGHGPGWVDRARKLYSPGHAVALVDLSSLHPIQGPDHWPERPFGDYSAGRWAWCMSGLRRLKPFPVQGRQGLFRVTMPDFEDWRE